MRKNKYFVYMIASLFIIGIITFGVLYIPEKPCDSLTDLDEISEHIADYIGDYFDNDIPTDNAKLNEMVESIAVVTVYPQLDEVEVAIVDCTFWKKQMFRREIINSKYVEFSDCESGVVNH